jgi:hypothetical protein
MQVMVVVEDLAEQITGGNVGAEDFAKVYLKS